MTKVVASTAATIPVNRTGKPEDIAAAASLFCAEEAGFISGQVLDAASAKLFARHTTSENPYVRTARGAMAQTFTGVDEVVHAVGTQLGETAWLEITQEQVNQFADATGDHQWIHVDVERASDGPYGGTIAHGYLTLSLIARFGDELFSVEGVTAKLNYGVTSVCDPRSQ
jgi:hypothetical protein